MATANALKPTTGATLLNYLHFPQALMIPPFSVLYLTVVYRTASCGLLSFFQVWRLAFEVRSKILLFKDTGPVDSKNVLFGSRYCFPCLITLFYMAMEKGNVAGNDLGQNSQGQQREGLSTQRGWPSDRGGQASPGCLTGVCKNGTLLVWKSQHLGTQSVMGYWCPETISFSESARSHCEGGLPSAPPAALAVVPSCRERPSVRSAAAGPLAQEIQPSRETMSQFYPVKDLGPPRQ